MSLATYHSTSHSTGFPSLARVPAQNFSNFEPIYVRLRVCSFPMALLFWNVHMRDLLKVWNSQWSRCTESLDSQTGWWQAFVGTYDTCKARHFLYITLISNLFLQVIVGHPATVVGKFQRGFFLKSFMRSGDMARICRGRLSIGILQGHTPCVLHCIPSRATSRPHVYVV